MPRVHRFATGKALAEAAADHIVMALRRAIAARGQASLVLTGGSTPAPVYRGLASRLDALAWPRVHVFWGDERCVPADHPDSNYRLARTTLLDALPIPEDQVHRMACEDDVTRGVRDYEAALAAFFGPGEPRFDVTLLGLGEDGHVASLFPGDGELLSAEEYVRAALAPQPHPVRERMTLTLAALNRSRLLLFLVTGTRKRAVLRRLFAEDGAADFPAAHVRTAGEIEWFVDAAAWPGQPE